MIAEKLKEATKHHHDAVEKGMYVEEIFNKTLSKQQYEDLIKVNYAFHSLIEEKVFNLLPAEDKQLLNIEKRRKLPALTTDRQALSLPQEIIPQLEIQVPDYNNKDEALGALYVMEGATLGGNVIVKHLKQTPGFSNMSFNYYGIYQHNTGDYWKAFIVHINQSIVDEDACTAGAVKAFQLLQNIILKVKETATV